MPNPKIHPRIDLNVFGEEYPEVHKWIDGTYDGTNGRTHWVNRHHLDAIWNEAYRLYPIETKERERFIQVASLHVLMDWAFYYKRIILPKTRREVIEELAKEGIFVE